MRKAALCTLAAIALLVACNKTKPVVEEAAPSKVSPGFFTGIVTTAKAKVGCPYLVLMSTDEGDKLLIPIGLDEQYLKDGLKLMFKFRPSRGSSGDCLAGRPAILEEVSVVK
ncbi:MAG: hypothetical protein WAU70_10950 [Flavobacteriales bacterium]